MSSILDTLTGDAGELLRQARDTRGGNIADTLLFDAVADIAARVQRLEAMAFSVAEPGRPTLLVTFAMDVQLAACEQAAAESGLPSVREWARETLVRAATSPDPPHVVAQLRRERDALLAAARFHLRAPTEANTQALRSAVEQADRSDGCPP